MSDSLFLLLDFARRRTVARRMRRAALVGGATCVVAALAATPLFGFPRSSVALLAIPIAVGVARCRAAPSRVALARRLDDRFATGDLLATALSVDDDSIGRAVVAQADAVAARLAIGYVAADREAIRRPLAIAGVAVAASLTLSALLSSPARPSPTGQHSPVARGDATATDDERATHQSLRDARRRDSRNEDAESADASRLIASNGESGRDAGRTAADGLGASRTDATIAAPPARRRPDAAARATGGAPANGDGDRPAGSTAAVATDGAAGRETLDVAGPTIVTPASIARDAIAAGRVPAASRSLVRAFFDAGESSR